jgi:hypothetical protein
MSTEGSQTVPALLSNARLDPAPRALISSAKAWLVIAVLASNVSISWRTWVLLKTHTLGTQNKTEDLP